jgi:hypothetical protein
VRRALGIGLVSLALATGATLAGCSSSPTMTICVQQDGKVMTSGAMVYTLSDSVKLDQVPGTYEVNLDGTTITAATKVADNSEQKAICGTPGHDF